MLIIYRNSIKSWNVINYWHSSVLLYIISEDGSGMRLSIYLSSVLSNNILFLLSCLFANHLGLWEEAVSLQWTRWGIILVPRVFDTG